MKSFIALGIFASVLCSCAGINTVRTGGEQSMISSGAQESARPVCDTRNVMQTRTRQHYQDCYGTMMTTDPSALVTNRTVYRWGITNQTPLTMAYFAAYLKPMGRFNRFNAKIYIDSGVKDSLTFFFKNGDREGEVIKSITVNPGQTVGVDFEISGIKKMYAGTELRTNHGKALKITIGEPEFYNCRQ